MIIGPIVEGQSEERVIPKVLDKLSVRYRAPSRAKGRPDLLHRARDYARLQMAKGATHVLFCFDADSPDGDSDLANLCNKLPEIPVLGCVPVHTLEAWLLADEEALAGVIGRKIEAIQSPEILVAPDQRLDEIFRTAGHRNGYIKTSHAVQIMSRASHQRLLRCSSYKKATDAIRST